MAFAIGRSKRKTFSFVSPGRRSVEDAKSYLKTMDSGNIVREEDGLFFGRRGSWAMPEPGVRLPYPEGLKK